MRDCSTQPFIGGTFRGWRFGEHNGRRRQHLRQAADLPLPPLCTGRRARLVRCGQLHGLLTFERESLARLLTPCHQRMPALLLRLTVSLALVLRLLVQDLPRCLRTLELPLSSLLVVLAQGGQRLLRAAVIAGLRGRLPIINATRELISCARGEKVGADRPLLPRGFEAQ